MYRCRLGTRWIAAGIILASAGCSRADRVVEGDVLVEDVGEEDRLGAVDARDVRHGQVTGPLSLVQVDGQFMPRGTPPLCGWWAG